MAMMMHWCDVDCINTEGLGLPYMPLDATIGQVFARIAPTDAMVIDFRCEKKC
jgi:hypothetical protein